MTDQPTADTTRALIADIDESLALVGDGDWTPQDTLLRQARAALSVSTRPDPDLDAIERLVVIARKRHAPILVELTDAVVALLARVRTAEAVIATIRDDVVLTQMTPHPEDLGAYVLGRAAERALFHGETASRTAETTPAHCPSCDGYQTDVMGDGQRSVRPCEGVEARTVETAEEWEYAIRTILMRDGSVADYQPDQDAGVDEYRSRVLADVEKARLERDALAQRQSLPWRSVAVRRRRAGSWEPVPPTPEETDDH